MKKVIILIGSYCSGKTETAINMAISASEAGKRTLVVDLDRINDYFRMSDQIPMLTEKRVNIVSPTFVGSGVTQTNMPAAVASAFDQDWDLVVFDVGGDQAGAGGGGGEVYDIVNVFRPSCETPEKILKLKGELEDFARQEVTGFVNNSNLLTYASADDLRHGYDILRETSDKSGIPIAHTTGRKKFLDEFLADGRDPKYIGEPIALETYMYRSPDNFTYGRI